VVDPTKHLRKTPFSNGSDIILTRLQETEQQKADRLQTVETLKQQGNTFLQQKQYADAILAYSNALKLSPNNSILYSNRSQANLSAKNYQGTNKNQQYFSFLFR
jgi:cytochrome c-type biogenesis protein CcmH/NrfG